MRWLRRLMLLAIAATVATAIGWSHGVDPSSPWAHLDGPWPQLIDGLLISTGFVIHHPHTIGLIVGVVLGSWLLGKIVALIPRRINKDPQRLFTKEQRMLATERCGGRCEGEGFFFTRCKGPAEQGDHWYPHSKGGPTTMENLAMLCQPHNGSKSNHTPSIWQTMRLEHRRRKYIADPTQRRPRGAYKNSR
jgi:hypothetical protein